MDEVGVIVAVATVKRIVAGERFGSAVGVPIVQELLHLLRPSAWAE
jgi:hypothetical protein